MRNSNQLVSLFVACLVIAACDSNSSDGDDGGTGPSTTPSLSGRWTARVSYLDYNVVDFTLTEGSNGTVSGSGFIQSNGQRNVAIQGLHSHPSVSLTLNGEARCTGSFTGKFTDNNTITGSVVDTRGDCRADEPWMLKRQ